MLHRGTERSLCIEESGRGRPRQVGVGMEPQTCKATVLVVEDRVNIRYLIEVALAQHRIATIPVGTAEEAMTACRNRLPDLVLADLLLPGCPGDTFVRALRRLPGAESIPVIMLSGIDNGLAASRAAGAQGFMAKPFDVYALMALVESHLRGSEAPQDPATAP